MDPVKTTISIAQQLESQSLNSIVAGFSFASALAYMDLVRWLISQVVKVNKNGGYYYLLTALLTTLLSYPLHRKDKGLSDERLQTIRLSLA